MKTLMTAACLLLVGAALAQQDQQQSSASQPIGGPPAELKALDAFDGEWVGTMKATVPGQGDMNMELTAKVEPWGNGMYRRITYSMKAANMPTYEAIMITGWDRQNGRYRSWTFDNMAPEPRIESGTFENGKLVMISEPHGGMVTRATWTPAGPNSWRLLVETRTDANMQQQDATPKWQPMVTAELRRKS